MNRLLTIFCFFFFFFGFFISELLRFYFLVYQKNSTFSIQVLLLGIAALSGCVLLHSFSRLRLINISRARQLGYGALIGIVSFYVLFACEDFLSEKRLYRESGFPEFSQVTGHCGVYAGRVMIHAYDQNAEPILPHHLKDYQMSNRCRANHLAELQKRHFAACAPNLDAVQCQIVWMSIFAEKGFWNVDSRRHFFERILELSDENKQANFSPKIKDTSWMEYAIKDYELASGNSTEMKQAGIEEQFSDEYLYYKQQEDSENLQLTQKIFAKVSELVSRLDPKSPDLLKYREVEREAASQSQN
jgi:hypothetical protein